MATQAQGTILKFTPKNGEQVTVGKLSAVGEIVSDSESVDVTTLDSEGGCRKYIQGFRDSGEVELTGFHEKGEAGQAALRAAYQTGEAGQAEVLFTDGTKVTFSAYVKKHVLGAAAVNGAIGFKATLRPVSPVAVTEV